MTGCAERLLGPECLSERRRLHLWTVYVCAGGSCWNSWLLSSKWMMFMSALSWKGWQVERAPTAPPDRIRPTCAQPHVSVVHIMGSCTALQGDRKLIQIVCTEGNDLITWQFISCRNLPESDSQADSQLFSSILLIIPQKCDFL